MREVLGFSTAGGGKPLKGETVTVETSEKMDNSATNFSVKPSNIPGYLDLTPEQASRLIKTEPLSDYYDVEEEPFARGKYAAVRRCRHKTSGRQFAAKFLRKRRRSSDLRTEIIHEVAVLESCKHTPRVVRLHEVYESSQEMVLLLELACGGELQMLLDKDEVPSEHQVLRLMRQILDGLMHLHSINVAHLDIKPQNLVLTGKFPDCDVKLCDFGISRYLSQGVDVREILGTPDYVAPEVLNYEPISLATDMWSVGVLLYVLLTGCSPFGGDTKQETFCNITQCRLDFPDDIFEDISEDAKDLMRKLMVKNPSKRLSATACLQHPWFTNPRPSSSLSSSAALNSLSIGATTPRTPTLSKRPAPTMEHSEDRSLSTDESDSDDSETDHNSKHNTEINSNFDSNTAETAQQNTEIEPNAEEIDLTFDQDHHEDKSSTMSSCCFDCNHEHEDKSSTISSSSTLTAESCSDRCSVVGASEFGCDNVQLTTSAGLGSMSSGTTCVGTSSVRTTSAGTTSVGKTSVGITSSGPSLVGTTSTGFSSLNQQQSAGPTPTGVTTKGLSEERKRSFMRNMESLVQKLSFTDTEGSLVDTHGSQKMNVNSLEGNSTYSKNINSFSNNNCSRTVCDIDLDSFVHSSSNINENKCSRFVSSSTPIHDRRGRFVDFDENNGDTSYRLSSKLNDTYTTSQYLSDSSDDSCRRFSKMNQSSGVKDSQYSSDSSDESSLRDSGFSSSKQQDDSKSSGSSDDDLRMSCCRGESSEFGDAKKGNINEATSGRTSMLRDSWYRDSKPSSASRFRQVDGLRNLTRASGVQTMPVSSFLHYKLDCGYNFLTRGSFGYESGDESVFKFRRVFILDDSEDRLSPPPSFNGSLSSDNSISDSNSDTISEMSIDSSSDRSSIISLDDSLDFVYGKSLGQARHYSTSCYNVWEAVKTQGPTSRSRVCPRECHGSFARALSKFTGSTESSELKEGNFHRQRKSLTIFNGYNTSASTSRSSTPPINKKCIGLELMREHNGNVVVIREVKAVHGSKFPRCSEVKCESVQSRIRRLQVQNGIRTELAKERYNVF